MDILAIAVTGFAPGLFWLWYIYRRDALEPEPARLVLRTFAFGLLAAFPVTMAEGWFGETFLVVAAGPVIEEVAKFLVVFLTIFPHAEFDEPMDGIVYSAAAALGFASIENAGYLVSVYVHDAGRVAGTAALSRVTTVFALRAILSVPGHLLFSSMWGFTLGWTKFLSPRRTFPLAIRGLILASVCHGFFNFLLVAGSFGSLFLLIFIPLLWMLLNRRIVDMITRSPHRVRAPSVAPDPQGEHTPPATPEQDPPGIS